MGRLIRILGSLEAHDPIGKRLERLLLSLPPDLLGRAIEENGLAEARYAIPLRAASGRIEAAEILALLDGPNREDRRLGWLAASRSSPRVEGLFEPLWRSISRGMALEPEDVPLAERCFLNRPDSEIDDEQIAGLIRNDATRTSGLILARRRGGAIAFAALMERVARGQADRETVACVLEVAERLFVRSGEPRRDQWLDSLSDLVSGEDRPMTARICAAVMLAVLNEKNGENVAGKLLLRGLQAEGEIRGTALDMVSFPTGNEIAPLLEALEPHRGEAGSADRERYARAIIRATGWNSLSAERIRLAIRRGADPEDLAALNRHLRLMSRMSSLDSYRVNVDF
jgi:hypothetical protein